MSGGAVSTIHDPSAIHPGEVARALNGLSETVLQTLAILSERCERAERELESLQASRTIEDDPRDRIATLEARIAELEERNAELAIHLAAERRLARLGEIAGGVAHEIRNPLVAARGFAELLGRSSGRDGHERRWAARVVEGIDEVDEIASSLASLAARQPLSREAIDADELLASAIGSARRTLEARGGADRWTFVKHVDSPRFTGDRTKLCSALRNLVANALRALPNGGRVEVRARLDGDSIEIAVHDSGPGVPAHVRRCDENTTRVDGTRLGLELARAIAELHGGRFEVSTNPGPLGGAVTFLRLPYEPR